MGPGNNIPLELKEFFDSTQGQALLIKGKPGTGKTILSLEILKEVCKEKNGLYLSTRLTPSRLHQLFPWINEVVTEKNVVNATQGKILESMSGVVSSKRSSTFDFGATLDFFRVLYEDAEEMDSPMVAIDSWDALLNYLRIEKEGAALAQNLCEFCRELGTHLIFVSETEQQTAIDYVADGVITLLDTEIQGEALGGQVYARQLESRSAREIELNKLRGVERRQKNYVFTLKDGRFRYFPPYSTGVPIYNVEPLPDIDEEHRSSGIKGFDEITGGLLKGILTLFEVEHGVGLRYIPFLGQIGQNLLAKKVGVVTIFSPGDVLPSDVEVIKKTKGVYPFIPEPLGSSLMETRKEYDSFLETLRGEYSEIAEIIGLDMIEALYGVENTLKLLTEALKRAKEKREILIVVAKRGMKSIEVITRMAGLHFVFKDLVGSLFIFGVQPRTGLYNVSYDEKGIDLIPVV